MKPSNNARLPESRLTDGLDPEQQASLGDISAVEALLLSNNETNPSPEAHARLLAALKTLLPAPGEMDDQAWVLSQTSRGWKGLLQLTRVQLSVVDTPFWWASGLVFLLGLLLVLLSQGAAPPVLCVLFAPMLAAVGVAYAFRPATQTLGELERISPTPALELFYARVLLVLSLNGGIAMLLMAAIWLREPQLILWRLLIAWVGPLLALSGLALLVTIRWGSLIGLLTPLGSWATLVYLGWTEVFRQTSHWDTAF